MSAEGFWGAEEKYEAANKATACRGERDKEREESGRGRDALGSIFTEMSRYIRVP